MVTARLKGTREGGITGRGSTQLQNGVSDDDAGGGVMDGGKNAREILIPFMGA